MFLGEGATSEALDQAATEIDQHHMDISSLRRKVQEQSSSSVATQKLLQAQAREILQLESIVQVMSEILLTSGAITPEALEERVQQKFAILSAPPPEPAKPATRRSRR